MPGAKTIARRNISDCKEVIDSGDLNRAKRLINEITATYIGDIPHIQNGLTMYQFHNETDYLADLRTLIRILEAFVGNKCKSYNDEKGITINSTNTNTSINNIVLNLDINQVIQELRENGSLNQEDIDEIIKKLEEIEEIAEGDENRNQKWNKLKGTLDWVSTKGVDIAIKILPFILQAVSQ